MRKNILKIALLLGTLIAIAVGISLFLPAKPPAKLKPLPNPNGYDALIRAARLTTRSVNDYRKLDQAELAAVVEANSNALRLASLALQQESRVPIQFTSAYMSAHLEDLASLKRFYEASLSELEDKIARTRANDPKLPYLRTLVVLTKKVELDLQHQVDSLTHLYRDLESMHDFVHEMYPAD